MTKRLEAPPDDHTLPNTYSRYGWIWSPEEGDWVENLLLTTALPLLQGRPPTPLIPEVISDATV